MRRRNFAFFLAIWWIISFLFSEINLCTQDANVLLEKYPRDIFWKTERDREREDNDFTGTLQKKKRTAYNILFLKESKSKKQNTLAKPNLFHHTLIHDDTATIPE